jgi:hypothetical protein
MPYFFSKASPTALDELIVMAPYNITSPSFFAASINSGVICAAETPGVINKVASASSLLVLNTLSNILSSQN